MTIPCMTSLRSVAVLVGRAEKKIKAGEDRETARRLGREQLFVFLAASASASPLVRPARQNRHATQANA